MVANARSGACATAGRCVDKTAKTMTMTKTSNTATTMTGTSPGGDAFARLLLRSRRSWSSDCAGDDCGDCGAPASAEAAAAGTTTFEFFSTTNKTGRGALCGWTTCPLCKPRSSKRFALGRGLAAHLHAVHAPWNPGKAELKRRDAVRKRSENERRRRWKTATRTAVAVDIGCPEGRSSPMAVEDEWRGGSEDFGGDVRRVRWDPTEEEVKAWGRRVAELTARAEEEAAAATASTVTNKLCIADAQATSLPDDCASSGSASASSRGTERKKKRRRGNGNDDSASRAGGGALGAGLDRAGKAARPYRDSLPPFLRAAADGDLDGLKRLLREEEEREKKNRAGKARARSSGGLLDARDRNGSTAEHWAAGGGHLDCLRFLLGLHADREEAAQQERSSEVDGEGKGGGDGVMTAAKIVARKVRRRDGKTALHYAARNGRDRCVDYLLSSSNPTGRSKVDARSGDGTTPLHLACYGGHPTTVRRLVETHRADPCASNDWGCGAAHWAAMTVQTDEDSVVETCRYLRFRCGLSFSEVQRQGHSPAHKAAQRLNRAVLEWLARPNVATAPERVPKGGGEGGGTVGDEGRSLAKDCEGAGLTEEEKAAAGAPDDGGNRPSDIWLSVGGDTSFGSWLRNTCGW